MTRKLIVLVGALLMVASACAAGEDTTQTGEPSILAMPPTTVVSSVDLAANSGDATSEGIQVHGHWTIEVLNPDGSVAEHREFENALTGPGGRDLAGLLEGTLSLCETTSGSRWRIGMATAGGGVSFHADVESTGATNVVRLYGSHQFGVADSITDVDTRFAREGTTGTCIFSPRFTRKDLSTPVTVEANQSIYVTVEIRFS